MIYNQALAYCQGKGGTMFGEIDGTIEQMDQFAEMIGDNFFLGIRNVHNHVVYHNTNGDDVSALLLWMDGQPDKLEIENCIIGSPEAIKSHRVAVGDTQCRMKRSFACILPV